MLHGRVSFLCLCILMMQLLQVSAQVKDEAKYRAHLEEKVMSELSLKELEALVENDDRVLNAPQGRIIIIPRPKEGQVSDDREAIVIERKPKSKTQRKKVPAIESRAEFKRVEEEGPQYRFSNVEFDSGVKRSAYDPDFEFDSGMRRSSYEPNFEFQSAFRHEEEFPSLFKISDLESAGSEPVRQFYESIVESFLKKQDFGLGKDAVDVLKAAASEDVPQYKPRFDYDAYSKDSTDEKLQGKPYWKDSPEPREEMIDENGCRTVIKRVVDPEDEKKPNSGKAKSVVITKECESPNIDGPDAKIIEGRPLRMENSRFPSRPLSFSNLDEQPSSYESTRPEELNVKKADGPDPLAPGYIDSMLDKHFSSFPGFTNPLSSFRGYQERFKLSVPEKFKDIKPTVGVQTYEYSHPKSGFEDGRQEKSAEEDSSNEDAPRVYEHHYNYDYPEKAPERSQDGEYQDESKEGGKSEDPEKPKMMKKSFAYYRKDNPKSDPDDQQYAEEYGTGNYRSFSSSYDSEKDGPKKKQ